MKRNSKKLLQEIMWWVAILVLSGNISWFLIERVMGDFGFGTLMQHILQQQRAPFQHRDLLPAIARWFELSGYPLAMYCRGVAFASVAAVGIVSRMLAVQVGANRTKALWISYLSVLVIPYVYALPIIRYYFLSDLAAVVLFGAGVFLIHKNSPWVLAVVFVGAFNRETIILLSAYSFVYGITTGRPLMRTVGISALIVLITAAVKGVLMQHYSGNPSAPGHSGVAWCMLVRNMKLFFQGDRYPGSMYLFQVLGAFGGLWIFAFGKSTPCRIACSATALVIIVAMLSFGRVEEVRVFQELLILAVVSQASACSTRVAALKIQAPGNAGSPRQEEGA